MYSVVETEEGQLRGAAVLEESGGHSRNLDYGLKTVKIMAAGFYKEGGAKSEFEDMVSYGHLGLASALSSFNDDRGTNFRNYAWNCIRNAMLDGMQADNNSTSPQLSDLQQPLTTDLSSELILHEAACSRDPLIQQIRDQDDARLHSALLKLPGREKLVIELQFFEELSVRDIGSRLGISEGRTYQIRTSALNRLRRSLSRSAL